MGWLSGSVLLRKMGVWLPAPTPGSSPITAAPGDPASSSGALGQPHTCAYTYTQAHTYINKNKLLKGNSILSSKLF